MKSVFIIIAHNDDLGVTVASDIIGVFYSLDKAEKHLKEYLSDKDRDFEKAFIGDYYIN